VGKVTLLAKSSKLKIKNLNFPSTAHLERSLESVEDVRGKALTCPGTPP